MAKCIQIATTPGFEIADVSESPTVHYLLDDGRLFVSWLDRGVFPPATKFEEITDAPWMKGQI